MIFKIFFAMLLVTLPFFSPAYAQAIDTNKRTETTVQAGPVASTDNNNNQADDFSPGMLFFALIGIVLVFICIGIGVALAAIVLLLIVGLITTGLVSASVIVGLNKRSFTKGFKTFLLLSGCVGGLALGVGALYLINRFFHFHLSKTTTVLVGGISGLAGGLLLGLLAYTMIIKVGAYFKQRLQIA